MVHPQIADGEDGLHILMAKSVNRLLNSSAVYVARSKWNPILFNSLFKEEIQNIVHMIWVYLANNALDYANYLSAVDHFSCHLFAFALECISFVHDDKLTKP